MPGQRTSCNQRGYVFFKPAGGCIQRCPPGQIHSRSKKLYQVTHRPEDTCYTRREGRIPVNHMALRNLVIPGGIGPIMPPVARAVRAKGAPSDKQIAQRERFAEAIKAYKAATAPGRYQDFMKSYLAPARTPALPPDPFMPLTGGGPALPLILEFPTIAQFLKKARINSTGMVKGKLYRKKTAKGYEKL